MITKENTMSLILRIQWKITKSTIKHANCLYRCQLVRIFYSSGFFLFSGFYGPLREFHFALGGTHKGWWAFRKRTCSNVKLHAAYRGILEGISSSECSALPHLSPPWCCLHTHPSLIWLRLLPLRLNWNFFLSTAPDLGRLFLLLHIMILQGDAVA